MQRASAFMQNAASEGIRSFAWLRMYHTSHCVICTAAVARQHKHTAVGPIYTHITQAEYAKTQKNKATEGHLGLVKAKIAKLKREILEGGDGKGGGGGGGGRGFDVQKSGDTRVACIGFPSVGKCVQLQIAVDIRTVCA
jgi:hypothetical protein